MLVIVINCLRVFCCCYHGDGSDGRHVCSKYHGHTYRLLCTWLLVMVVMGDTCVQIIIVINYLVVGDGSDGRHVCLKYHGHYQATMLVLIA